MRLKIDMTERKCKNLEFRREVNKAEVVVGHDDCDWAT
jgi:hypothetical protein